MSWMANPFSEAPVGPPPSPPPQAVGETDALPEGKARDPSIPGRIVSTKQANKPFLAFVYVIYPFRYINSDCMHRYKEYRDKQEAEHKAWEKRMKEREERIAKGLKVGPKEKDPTLEEEVGLLGLLKFLACVAIFIILAGKFFTGSFIWEYEGKWTNLNTYLPVSTTWSMVKRALSNLKPRKTSVCSPKGYSPSLTALSRTNPSTLL